MDVIEELFNIWNDDEYDRLNKTVLGCDKLSKLSSSIIPPYWDEFDFIINN